MTIIRERMLLLPQLAGQLVGESRETIQKRIDAAVREALSFLAHKYDVEPKAGAAGLGLRDRRQADASGVAEQVIPGHVGNDGPVRLGPARHAE